MDEMFLSAVRSKEDLAGVFEYDGDVGYFYLYDVNAMEGKKIKDSIRVFVGPAEFSESDADVRWSSDEQKVGFFVKGRPVAVYDLASSRKYGGGSNLADIAPIPAEIVFLH
jgi:hypothetical protein